MLSYATNHDTHFNENVLSSVVFEVMDYLPPDALLLPFLTEFLRGEDLPPTPPMIKLQESLSVPDSLAGLVANSTVIPDVILTCERTGWTLVVEAELSHEVETQQMCDQFAVAAALFPGRDLHFLLLNSSMTPPALECGDLEALLSRHSKAVAARTGRADCARLARNIHWLNWQTIHALARSARKSMEGREPRCFSDALIRMLDRLLALLEKRGLGSLTYIDPRSIVQVESEEVKEVLEGRLLRWLSSQTVDARQIRKRSSSSLAVWLAEKVIKVR